MTTMIQRAESAATREEAVAVFRDAGKSIGRLYGTRDYWRHISQAERSGSDDRAKGYLLLAAMAVVPEGQEVTHLAWGDGSAAAILGFRHGQNTADSGGYLPCTALLAAILKTDETNER